jgi:hypothetical protein
MENICFRKRLPGKNTCINWGCFESDLINSKDKMDCPYCEKDIYGMTGLQEAQAFQKHLRKCKKNPNNVVGVVGGKKFIHNKKPQNLIDAVEIRAESGQ